jgi:hypothetical protein
VIDPLHLVSALARRVGRAAPTEPLVARMCRAVVDLLDVDGGSVTCAPADEGRAVLCSTDPFARRVAEIEEVTGEGPGLAAFREQRSAAALLGVRAGGVPGPERTIAFPLFVAALGEAADLDAEGAVEVRSWPVRAGGVPVAVLTLHARGAYRRALPVAEGQVLADALSGSIAGGGPTAAVRQTEERRRARVHRAVGMVVAQTGLPPADALALLRARAFTGSTGLSEVVEAVLDRRLAFSGDRTR